MATTPKTKKPVSSTKSKGIVASKKKGLSKKQWGIISVVGVLVLAASGYFGFQAYQNLSSNAAGYTQIQAPTLGWANNYVRFVSYACKVKTSTSGYYTLKGKLTKATVSSKYSSSSSSSINNKGMTAWFQVISDSSNTYKINQQVTISKIGNFSTTQVSPSTRVAGDSEVTWTLFLSNSSYKPSTEFIKVSKLSNC